MTSGETASRETRAGSGDLTCSAAALWLWRVPPLMIVVGAFWPAVRFWLWIPAFLVAGAACVVNARRGGGLHAYATGPLYLGTGGYLALTFPGRVPFHLVWLLGVVVGLSLLARLAERHLGRYRASAPSAPTSAPMPATE